MKSFLSKVNTFIKNNFQLILLTLVCFVIFFVSVKVTLFRYSNFEFGKFDLGNMGQMVYNTMNGRFLEVTDYFGENMPRWGMSHVDPFLILFVPAYFFFPDARVLVVSQLALVIFSAVILFFISNFLLKSKTSALFIGLAYLFYPANGYLLAWTGFHSVTAVIPFFLLAFLTFEKMHDSKIFSKKSLTLFYLLLIITMSGKEQISLIVAMYGVFILLFRGHKKVALSLIVGGVLWFIACFFYIIPSSAHYRIDGYKEFAKSVGLDQTPQKDVLNSNYFIGRYDEFGNSISEVVTNIILNPVKVVDVFFSGDKKENFTMTFLPVLFLPFFAIPVMAIASPDILINYMTTSGGIGTSEIFNHRISMIIPLIFLSVIFSILLFQNLGKKIFKEKSNVIIFIPVVFSLAILLSNLYYSDKYQNPIMLWFTQSLGRRLAYQENMVFAKDAPTEQAQDSKDYKVGDKVKINKLEVKDMTCFNSAIALVPEDASVSAPDYLGAHLSSRRVNALFPANFESADYVLVDIFSKKVATILGVDPRIVNNAVGKLVKNPEYKLIYSCSNLFVFKKGGIREVSSMLPLQEEFTYPEKYNLNISQSLYVVDFALPSKINRNTEFALGITYKKDGGDSLNSYNLYTSFRNKDTGELVQIANLPSFGIHPVTDWDSDTYYIEDNRFVIPETAENGLYDVFIGMTNGIKTSNIYLGSVNVE